MKEQLNKTLAKPQILVFGRSARYWLVSSKRRVI